MTAQPAEQPVRAGEGVGHVTDRIGHQPATSFPALLKHGPVEIVGPGDVRGLVHDQPVSADHVVHPGEVDPAEAGQQLDCIEERRREPAHVPDHHGGAAAVARGNDRLGFPGREAHGFLDQHVQPMSKGVDHGLGVVFVAVQHQDRVNPAGRDQLGRPGIAAGDTEAVAHLAKQPRREITARLDLKQPRQRGQHG